MKRTKTNEPAAAPAAPLPEWPEGSEGQLEELCDALADNLARIIAHPHTPPWLAVKMADWLPQLEGDIVFEGREFVEIGANYAQFVGGNLLRCALGSPAREGGPRLRAGKNA